MILKPLLWAVLVSTLILSLRSAFRGQTTTSGALAGIVTDHRGRVIPNADLQLRDVNKGTVQSTRTDHQGEYRFFFLAPGRYTLTVSHDGFRAERRTVDVLLGLAVTVNVALATARSSAEIMVADEVPLIQAENGDASATMLQKQISEVSNPGNDLTYIVQTTPGVVMDTDVPTAPGMNFSILGMPSMASLLAADSVRPAFHLCRADI
jgi:hypothetical protein